VWASLDNDYYVRIHATPSRALTNAEVKEVVAQYGLAAKNAKEAGFSGVEIHATGGYLVHQFLSSTTNLRTDEYGGSEENRARFLSEIIEAVKQYFPADYIGVRLCPYSPYNNARDVDHEKNYGYVAAMLQKLEVGFIEITDTTGWFGNPLLDKMLEIIKPHYKGQLFVNGGLSPEAAENLIKSGQVDVVAFGRHFIANPDLPERIKRNGPYNELRHEGVYLYGGGAEGYVDYPSLPSVEQPVD